MTGLKLKCWKSLPYDSQQSRTNPLKDYSGIPLNYKDSGVDISAGDELIRRIKPCVEKTRTSGVLSGLGGFGALFELPLDRFKHPVLVSGTDGVGTKLKLANWLAKHDTIGIDLVAMCVNDILVQGAEPLFFLDYFATGSLHVDIAAAVVRGISEGCQQAGAALVGGETAEMPGMYGQDDYDLAGFCVGIVEKNRIIDGTRITPGDKLIGIESSGPHSNGYSLIRKVIELNKTSLGEQLAEKTIGEHLLQPTRIYVKSILRLLQSVDVHGIAHITGGGITENLPRILPKTTKALINLDSWKQPPIFSWLQKNGQIENAEMLRTFNCGIGMILCVAPTDETTAMQALKENGESVYTIGTILESKDGSVLQYQI